VSPLIRIRSAGEPYDKANLERDLIDRLAKAVDPAAFSDGVREHFIEASKTGEPTVQTLHWMPRIVAARKVASRVMDVLKPTEYMLHAADALLGTHPDATPEQIFNMMIYAERDVALRKSAPGIDLEDVPPEDYLEPAVATFG
jgi:hypothetical protein